MSALVSTFLLDLVSQRLKKIQMNKVFVVFSASPELARETDAR